jgi:hypothetical protein
MAKKLEIYGFNQKALALFNSYMTNRTKQVQIGQFINILLFLHHNSILFKSSWTLVCIAELFPQKCAL